MTDKSKEFLKRSIEELRLIKIDKIASQTDSKIHEEDSILDVVEELIINSREVLPVIKNNELIGIIRKNKIATKIEKNKDYEKIKAKEIMETNFISCSLKDSLNKILEEAIKNNSDTIIIFMHPGDSLNEAFKIFKEKRFNQIPLIAEGKLVGILKINDAIKTYYQFLLNIKNPKNDFDIQEI